jgi:hypothetical protein
VERAGEAARCGYGGHGGHTPGGPAPRGAGRLWGKVWGGAGV